MTGVRLLTPPGRGAVAVLSVEGEGALARVAQRLDLPLAPPGSLRLVRPRTDEGVLDEALLVVLSERAVELHVHGSPPLVSELLERLGPAPARTPAASLEERAWELLPGAACEGAARLLLDQAEGALRQELERLRDGQDGERLAGLKRLLAGGRAARFALRPARVVIAGPVNAGKSTLFNALMAHERVLVSPEAGTTRDAILGRVLLGEWPVDLIDTAGERQPDAGEAGEVERAGQDLARSIREQADLVLRLEPPGGAGDPGGDSTAGRDAPAPRERAFASLADLDPEHRREAGRLSVLQNPEQACLRVARRFRETFLLPAEVWMPGRAVPFDGALLSYLEDIGRDVERKSEEELREALDSLLREPQRLAPPAVVGTIAGSPRQQ